MNNLLQIISDGLTYEGNVLHSCINYGLIAITIAPRFVLPKRSHISRGRQWMACLLIAVGVQIVLWFGLGAVGVSVVWSTLAGYSLIERVSGSEAHESVYRGVLNVALLSALVGILYYAVTFPIITTIAHGVALLMGVAIWYLLRFASTKRIVEGSL